MAPLQKRALYSFIVGLVLTIALAAVLVARGSVTALENDLSLRLILYAVLIGVPLIYLILMNLTLRKPTQFDERDRLIIERSSRAQWLAVIFTLVAWTITLTEIYRNQGQVPTIFLNLIFMSTLIIGTLAQSLGILVGYWEMNRNE
jgi:heme/copper-type cytochrome/quinol oxidase subunit 4